VVEITGRLNALLGERAYPNKVRGVWGKMVAEEGFEPPTHGLRIMIEANSLGSMLQVAPPRTSKPMLDHELRSELVAARCTLPLTTTLLRVTHLSPNLESTAHAMCGLMHRSKQYPGGRTLRSCLEGQPNILLRQRRLGMLGGL
jgi:hypothetical protein